MTPEIRDIPGFPGYGASADGRIWSRKAMRTGAPVPTEWRLKMSRPNTRGYHSVVLCTDGGGRFTRRVCRLVTSAWHGEPGDEVMQANHKNGDKQDDSAENLEWVTPKENIRHAENMGLRKKTPMLYPKDRRVLTKLSHEKASIIRHAFLFGCGMRDLARVFGVGYSVIFRVISGEAWDPFRP